MDFWRRIFIQSKVNGGVYDGESLPAQNWKWPEGRGSKATCPAFERLDGYCPIAGPTRPWIS
jgi:hypothetical protein